MKTFFIVATDLHCGDKQLQQQRQLTRIGIKSVRLLLCTLFSSRSLNWSLTVNQNLWCCLDVWNEKTPFFSGAHDATASHLLGGPTLKVTNVVS